MLFKTAIARLLVWLLGMLGVYRVGDLTHVFLLVGTDALVARRAQGAGSCLAAP